MAATRKESRLACVTRSKALAALVLALACEAAGAQDAEARIEALESKVDELQKRVDVLEGRTSAAAAAPAPSVAACAGADRLRMSMTEAEVRAVLGAPPKVDATPLQRRWRYPCGTAYFDADTRLFRGYEAN